MLARGWKLLYEITYSVFRVAFLEKYFPADLRSKKEIKYLELKLGNIIIAEYVVKFEELVKLFPHYNNVTTEESKCVKFESKLCSEIKMSIGYQEYTGFLL